MNTFARASAPALKENKVKGLLLNHEIMIAPGNVWSRRMESDVENAFVKLFPVSGYLLHARLAFKIPQPE